MEYIINYLFGEPMFKFKRDMVHFIKKSKDHHWRFKTFDDQSNGIIIITTGYYLPFGRCFWEQIYFW